jgi:hypothetical protein
MSTGTSQREIPKVAKAVPSRSRCGMRVPHGEGSRRLSHPESS